MGSSHTAGGSGGSIGAKNTEIRSENKALAAGLRLTPSSSVDTINIHEIIHLNNRDNRELLPLVDDRCGSKQPRGPSLELCSYWRNSSLVNSLPVVTCQWQADMTFGT